MTYKAGPPHRTLLGNGKFIVEESVFPRRGNGRPEAYVLRRADQAARVRRCMDASNAVGVRLVPQLFGRHYTRADLERRVGRLDQIAGITPA